jgi:glycosyltransferase involved in cell wall biosynthesis
LDFEAMKIAIISHLKYAICEPFSGGLEMHTHLLASFLKARGHCVTLFAAHGSDHNTDQVSLCTPTSFNAITSDGVEHDAYTKLMANLDQEDFDIIHNNSLHYVPLGQSASLSIPMVTTLHTPPFESLADAAAKWSSYAHRFVAVSQTLAAQWAPIASVDHVIPNGIDLSQFRFQSLPDNTAYWVWHGRIVPEKGLHLAIDAARIAGIHLRFAGPISDPGYFATEIAPRLGAEVSYAGHLTHRDLARLIGGARICLCTPRWEEPFGLVIAEALACGTPVAGFRRGALPELLDPSCGVLIDSESPSLLATAGLEGQSLDRGACRARAEQLWDASRMIEQYEQIYQELIDRRMIRRAA